MPLNLNFFLIALDDYMGERHTATNDKSISPINEIAKQQKFCLRSWVQFQERTTERIV